MEYRASTAQLASEQISCAQIQERARVQGGSAARLQGRLHDARRVLHRSDAPLVDEVFGRARSVRGDCMSAYVAAVTHFGQSSADLGGVQDAPDVPPSCSPCFSGMTRRKYARSSR